MNNISVLAVTRDGDLWRDECDADRHSGDGHLRHQNISAAASECPQCKHPSPHPHVVIFIFHYTLHFYPIQSFSDRWIPSDLNASLIKCNKNHNKTINQIRKETSLLYPKICANTI
jgi:hypothetical protein